MQTDQALQKELILLSLPGKKTLGIPLISSSSSCLCGSELQLRKDHPAPIIIRCGTVPGAHYHKFCPKMTCSFTQYYCYYTTQGQVIFTENWSSVQYFISSRDTTFSLDTLRCLDANVLIGQISFKQQADIYNYTHGYSKSEAKMTSRFVCYLCRAQNSFNCMASQVYSHKNSLLHGHLCCLYSTICTDSMSAHTWFCTAR